MASRVGRRRAGRGIGGSPERSHPSPRSGDRRRRCRAGRVPRPRAGNALTHQGHVSFLPRPRCCCRLVLSEGTKNSCPTGHSNLSQRQESYTTDCSKPTNPKPVISLGPVCHSEMITDLHTRPLAVHPSQVSELQCRDAPVLPVTQRRAHTWELGGFYVQVSM